MDYDDWRFTDPLPPLHQSVYEAPLHPNWPPKIDMSKMDLEYWKKTWEGALTLPEIFVVDNQPWGPGVQGWTSCNKEDRNCQITIDRQADYDSVKLHEYMHALGWDHPDYPRHLPGFHSPLSFD